MTLLPRGFWPRIALAWLAVACVLVIRNWAAIQTFQLDDPDDALRLVQVRDLIGGQGWFDLHQYRIDPPAGVASHWSRLVDTPLVAVILLLRPLLGQTGAEQVAAVLVPLFTLLCAMALTARIARLTLGPRAAFASCLAWLLALTATAQLQPMRIDHHGWQIVAVLAALNGLLEARPRRGGWIIGGALALGMSISLELLPFTALFAAVLGLRWLCAPQDRGWLVQMLAALALVSTAAFLLTRGTVFDNHCDTVTPPHLIGFTLAALLVGAIAEMRQVSRLALVALLGGAGLLVGGLYLMLAPQCIAGPFAALDPLVRDVWYSNVLEGMPAWRQDLPTMAQMLVPPLAGLAVLVATWRGAALASRPLQRDLALLLGGSILIAMLVARFSGVAAAIATVPLGFLIAEWLRRADRMSVASRILALPLILLVLIPAFPVGKVRDALVSRPPAPAAGGEVVDVGRGCSLPASLPALNGLPRATVFAPFEIGPTLLLDTRLSVVATGHHRAASAMHDVIAAYMARPDRAEALVRKHGAQFVVACGDLNEARNYRVFAPAGLMARLLADQPPAWLEPVGLPASAGNLKVWKVRRQPG